MTREFHSHQLLKFSFPSFVFIPFLRWPSLLCMGTTLLNLLPKLRVCDVPAYIHDLELTAAQEQIYLFIVWHNLFIRSKTFSWSIYALMSNYANQITTKLVGTLSNHYMYMACVHRIPKNLGANSKVKAPWGWHEHVLYRWSTVLEWHVILTVMWLFLLAHMNGYTLFHVRRKKSSNCSQC